MSILEKHFIGIHSLFKIVSNLEMEQNIPVQEIFSRVHATLQAARSVGRSVCLSVGRAVCR